MSLHVCMCLFNHGPHSVETEKYKVTGLWSHSPEAVTSLSLTHSSLLNHHIISWQKLRG